MTTNTARAWRLGIGPVLLSLFVLIGCSVLEDITGGDGGGGGVSGRTDRGPMLFEVSATTATIKGHSVNGEAFRLQVTPTANVQLVSEEQGEYEFQLSGLTANTTYRYQLEVDDTLQTTTHQFRTHEANPTTVNFAAYGDSRTGTAKHSSIASDIINWDPAFVVHVGDYVDDDKTSDWDSQFFAPAGPLLSRYFFLGAQGNHEDDSTTYAAWLARGDDNLYQGSNFTWSYGPVWFLVLNSTHTLTSNSDQYNYAQQQLESSAAQAATWRIVVMHHPYDWSADRSSDPPEDFAADLIPMFKQNNVQMIFAGHTHSYERLQDEDLTLLITGGGGANLNTLGERRPNSVVWAREYHWCRVEATQTELRLRALTPEGTTLDSFTLTP